MTHYREVQQFRHWWMRLILWSAPVLFAFAAWRQVVLGIPFGSQPMSDRGLLIALAVSVLFSLWLWNVRLIIEVRDDALEFVMWLIWRRRRIPLGEIRRAEVVTYRPLLEYGGWGIRRGRDGWCYNTGGDRGVRLELAGGEKLLLGSQDPERLAQAILQRRGLSSVV